MSGVIGTSPDMLSGVVGKYPAGHVLQVQTSTVTTTIYSTTQDWNDIDSTNLAVSLTMSSASNKVLVIWSGGIGMHNGWTPVTRVVRDYATAGSSTVSATSTGSGPAGVSIAPGYSDSQESSADQTAHFFDTPGAPAGTAIQYKMQWYGRQDATGANYCNRQQAGYTASHYGAGISTISVWEITA